MALYKSLKYKDNLGHGKNKKRHLEHDVELSLYFNYLTHDDNFGQNS